MPGSGLTTAISIVGELAVNVCYFALAAATLVSPGNEGDKK